LEAFFDFTEISLITDEVILQDLARFRDATKEQLVLLQEGLLEWRKVTTGSIHKLIESLQLKLEKVQKDLENKIFNIEFPTDQKKKRKGK
jgi:hypothetical protein